MRFKLGILVCRVCDLTIYLWLTVDNVTSDINIWACKQVFQLDVNSSWLAHNRPELSFLSLQRKIDCLLLCDCRSGCVLYV